MGFDNMRSAHARCPVYLVAGMILVSFLLTFNWWSLSMQNYELRKQMEDMGDQLNICSDERVICVKRRNGLETQVRDGELRTDDLRAIGKKSEGDLKKMKSELADATRANEKASQALTYCQTELESLKKVDVSKTTTLASMRLEKETMAAQLIEAKEKIKELEAAAKVKHNNNMKDSKIQPSPFTKKDKDTVDGSEDGPVFNADHQAQNEELDEPNSPLGALNDSDTMAKPPELM